MVSFLTPFFLLALISANSTSSLPSLPTPATCVPQSSPNPIAATYPHNVTGTINETLTVLPISYELARSIIPAKYNILQGYQQFLPAFPADSYPLIMETTIDHGVQSNGISVSDFSTVRFSFPFIDLLGDGYSNFKYTPTAYVSDNLVAVAGLVAYGTKLILSTFDPPCDAYAFSPGEKAMSEQTVYFKAFPVPSSAAAVDVSFTPCGNGDVGPYPLSFYKNITNQPIFANGLFCDQQIRLFNTSLTTGQNAPIGINGNVTLKNTNVLGAPKSFAGVYGIKADTAFIENNFLACGSLRGYGGP